MTSPAEEIAEQQFHIDLRQQPPSPIPPMTTPVFRTPLDGCYRQVITPYGKHLAKARDPLSDGDLPKEVRLSFELHENPPQIPAALWNAWVLLCFELVHNSNGVEVGCRILRCISKPDEWRILIPDQSVTGASVHSEGFDNSIDLITGETIPSYPPEDWQPMGTSHSHNTMEAFFSAIDDSTELGDPGLHIVVGSINLDKNTYSLKASITASQRRHIIAHEKVIDMSLTPGQFHKNVLANIREEPIRGYLPQQWWDKPAHGNYWNSLSAGRYRWSKKETPQQPKQPGGQRAESSERFPEEEEFDAIEQRITEALNELCAVERACDSLEARQAYLLMLENFVEELTGPTGFPLDSSGNPVGALTGMEAAGTFDLAAKPEDEQALEVSL
jgi:hypothetical protein